MTEPTSTEPGAGTELATVDDAAVEASDTSTHGGSVTEHAPGLLPGEVHPHPSPLQYVLIAVILCVVTALEIAVSYTEGDIPDALIVVLLLGMALLKFILVAAWFMHLRTDLPIFKRFFVLGIILAMIVYLIALATLNVF